MGEKKEKGPFDGPSMDIHSDKFKDVVMNLMMKKHLDPDDEFNLLD
tara:strand:- start:2827 stop:2964 length:138 start_codon:yes stop_codon:yes gene_type:complete